MSLKAFHIIFIIFSTLLAVGTGVWCVWVDLVEGAPIYLAGAIASFICAFALIVYGVWFYRKMKRLRIITRKQKSCRCCFCRFFRRLARHWDAHFATARRTENRASTWPWPSGFCSAQSCRLSVESGRSVFVCGGTGARRLNLTRSWL